MSEQNDKREGRKVEQMWKCSRRRNAAKARSGHDAERVALYESSQHA